MIQIYYRGLEDNIKTAVENTNLLLHFEGFYNSIRRHRKFDMANVPPSWIADLMLSCDLILTIDFYYSINPFSNALSYDDKKNPMVIHLNKWNLNRSEGSICNTLVHHCVHAINHRYPQYSFGHGDDETAGKENTAPFWIANLAQQIIMKDDTVGEALSHELDVNIPDIIRSAKQPSYWAERQLAMSR